MPFPVGGGINSLAHIEKLINSGVERLVIGNEAAANPKFIYLAANTFGSSTIIVCMDVKKNLFGKEMLVGLNGKLTYPCNVLDFAKLVEQHGVGELVVQSVDRDGKMNGYEKKLIKRISDEVSVPVIALGGAGNYTHLKECTIFAM